MYCDVFNHAYVATTLRFAYLYSPGPVYFVHPSITKTGKDGTSAYTMYGRLKTRADNRSPGPGLWLYVSLPYSLEHMVTYSKSERCFSVYYAIWYTMKVWK